MPDTDLHERFRAWLRDRHLPISRPRDLVAGVVFKASHHLAVDDIQRLLRDQGHRIGTATVYRALDILVESGLVRPHDFGEGFKRYEAVRATSEHGYLICSRCGTVTEFSTERFERMLPLVADEHDFQHHRHRVEIHGLCQPCQRVDFGTLARAGRR